MDNMQFQFDDYVELTNDDKDYNLNRGFITSIDNDNITVRFILGKHDYCNYCIKYNDAINGGLRKII